MEATTIDFRILGDTKLLHFVPIILIYSLLKEVIFG